MLDSALPILPLSATYNDMGNTASITYPSGLVQSFRYDADGHCDSVLVDNDLVWRAESYDGRHAVSRFGSLRVKTSRDAMGRVAAKVTGGLETTAYAYNIQSWPTKMQGLKFTEVLTYEGTSDGLTPSTPQWSGKVSAMRCFRGNPNIKPAYQFTYDGMGRLAGAAYTQNTYLMNRRPKYTETYSYDAMGNITSLTRQGFLYSATWGDIDDLVMEYEGNRIAKCDDAEEIGLYASPYLYQINRYQ